MVELIETQKDTPLKTLSKRTDPTNFSWQDKAKMWSVISFLIQNKEPAKKDDKLSAKEQNLFRKFILALKKKSLDESLSSAYNGWTLDELDNQWRKWLLGLKKAGKIKPVKPIERPKPVPADLK